MIKGAGLIAGIAGLASGAAKTAKTKELAEQQMSMNKEMAKYNQQLALEMWEKTNYKAQVEQMKKAGLNPALMYQQGGAGGSTAGAGVAESATLGDASAVVGMGLQAELQKAQIASIAAQTEKTQAEADKIKGVDTEKGKVDIEAAKQNIENAKQQFKALEETIRGQKADNVIKEFNAEIHKYLKENYTTFKEFDGYDENGNPVMKVNRQLYTERMADIIMQRAEKDGLEISTEEKELINRKEIAIRLAQDIDAIAKGELDRLTISSKNLEKLQTEIKRNKYELEQDTAISKMLDDTVGLGEYTRFLGKFIQFYFRRK